MNSDRPTAPPTAADAKASEFASRLAVLESGARTSSGLFRALAEAWAESEKAK